MLNSRVDIYISLGSIIKVYTSKRKEKGKKKRGPPGGAVGAKPFLHM